MELAKSDRGWMSGVVGDDVVTIGDPRLKADTETVGDFHDVAGILARMVDRLRELNGAGLAAPQLGASVKVIVIEVRKTDVFPDRPTSPLLQMINPVIVGQSGTTETGWEGCFSVPGLMGVVARAQTITVEYTTANGTDVTEQYSGYVARMRLFRVVHQPRLRRDYTSYEPRLLPVPARHAAYSANLLLAVCTAGSITASELYGTQTPYIVDSWHSQTLLWRSQLTPKNGPAWSRPSRWKVCGMRKIATSDSRSILIHSRCRALIYPGP